MTPIYGLIRRLEAATLLLLLAATAHESTAVSRVSEPFAGVRYTVRTQTAPRPLSIHILEIDGTHPGVSFLVTPSNGAAAGENAPQTVRAFATQHKTQIAINGTFYSWPSGGGLANSGLVASRGDVYSPFDGDTRPWPVFNIGADNFAQIVDQATPASKGTAVNPPIALYNALSGSERLVTDGRNTGGLVNAGSPTTLNPRTAIGLTADRRIVIVCIDGRRAGFSEGTLNTETADLMLQYGVTDAVNLDGGGSTTLVFADPTPRAVNRYSDATERTVAASLGVYAAPASRVRDLFVWADFYKGDRGGFRLAPSSTPSAAGLAAASTNEALADIKALERGWIQRLTLRDDPSVTAPAAHPGGGWYLPHSWSPVTESEAAPRPLKGCMGLRARTRTPGILIAPSVLESAARAHGTRRTLVADGAWHLYEWDLAAAAEWVRTPVSGAAVDPGFFLLEALHLYGPDADAVVDFDLVAHNALGTLGSEVSAPNDGQLGNMSSLCTIGTPADTAVMGFVVRDAPRRVLVRAVGPSLASFGVSPRLPDPKLSLYTGERLTAINDNWGGGPVLTEAFSRSGAFALEASSKDAAIAVTLQPGAYTAIAESVGGTTGRVLLEVYALD